MQEKAIPSQEGQRSMKRGRSTAWLSKDLLELRWKRKLNGHQKQGQARQEDYKNIVHHRREKICILPLG